MSSGEPSYSERDARACQLRRSQAITTLLTTYEPECLRLGLSLFMAFATILIVWQGVRMMLSQDSLGDHLFEFAKLLMFISFGYALVAFYESPIPGIGISFSNLITDQTHTFVNILDARSLELVFDHLDQLWQQFVQPDAWSILANLLYWLLLVVVTLAKVVSLAVVAFGLIASAVCALVGPIFVPFFIVPKLDWLFWSPVGQRQAVGHSHRFCWPGGGGGVRRHDLQASGARAAVLPDAIRGAPLQPVAGDDSPRLSRLFVLPRPCARRRDNRPERAEPGHRASGRDSRANHAIPRKQAV
jgi:hypothetical protein